MSTQKNIRAYLNSKDIATTMTGYRNSERRWGKSINVGNELYFEAKSNSSTISLNKVGSPTSVTIEYSTNYLNWNTYTFGETITLPSIWDRVYFRNTSTTDTNFSTGSWSYYQFEMTGSIAWWGDINFLLNKNSTTTLTNYCYYNIFKWCTWLTIAPELPATTLAIYCYYYMFYWCTWLTTAPELPATTLASICYSYMFNWCTWLTTAPELPATTLANNCYYYMFNWCTWLTIAPELPATTLASNCYSYMFQWCTWLTIAPELPATTLTSNCYQKMFNWCTWLTIAPELPATTLANDCYTSMFYWCTWLTSIPALPATTLTNYCYSNMFYWCRKIKLSTTQTWEYQTAYRIPNSWTGTEGKSSLYYMFWNTGWTFKSTPTINTTYYTSNTIVS